MRRTRPSRGFGWCPRGPGHDSAVQQLTTPAPDQPEIAAPAAADPRRLALLARVHRRYRTVTAVMRFGPTLALPFTRVENPDVVLDQVAEEEDRLERVSGKRVDADQLHLPYWAELWDSAVGTGLHLAASPQLVAGRSVLDLGCGQGLSGTVAAALGARVLFADLEPPALLFAALNSAPWRARVRTRQLNWQRDALGERFDLILGADILYERKQWDFLEPFWRRHLAPGGTVLLGEPGRQTGDGFVEWIAPRGWRLESIVQPVPTREKPVRMLALVRR
jgi:predicted nicotinamide N-methyase